MPLLTVKILTLEAAISKEESAGALAAATMLSTMFGAFVGSALGGMLAVIVGFEWTMTILACTIAAVYLPISFMSVKYDVPPSRGPFAI